MPDPKVLLKPAEVLTLVDGLAGRMADEIGRSGGDWAIVGIRTGGDALARLLAGRLREQGTDLPVGALDITFYRDDLNRPGAGPSQPVVRRTEIDFEIDGRPLFLVDDVLYTGRTVRAALDELTDFGRPDRIRMAVLIDRGGREVPIQPDLAGRRLEVPPECRVVARFEGSGAPVVTTEPGARREGGAR